MSSTAKQSNLDIVKGAYDAFARGTIDEVTAVMAEDIEWVEAEGGPNGGVYHGPEEVVENVFVPLGTEWEGFTVDVERYVADGDTVVALGTYSGSYAETGKGFEAAFAHAIDLEDGMIVRFQQYTDTALHNEPLAG
jgi:hypothetical protein